MMNFLSFFVLSFNILVFGHSFGNDCTEYLPLLAEAADIEDVRVARFAKGNCSLEERYKFFKEDYNKGFMEYVPGGAEWERRPCTFKEAIAERKWDVVVFQQSLEGEGRYETIQPWLDEMVSYVRKVQKKKFKNSPRICWNMFWPISTILENSSGDPHHYRMSFYGHSSMKAYEAYVATAKEIQEKTGLDVIPTGTAIMSLRASSWNTPERKQFTRDGYHMSKGCGRYAAACVWFQFLIAPEYSMNILGNPLRMPDIAGDPVDDSIAPALQKAAMKAVEEPWVISSLD